ncbi:MAG: hypothetical protein JWO82_2740 [Akkermansiaceae bacterium]|nr:hypothetical protein [Akkermansiaceae bacterium]
MAAPVRAAIPAGLFVEQSEDCCDPLRLELTAGGEAYLARGRDPVTGTVVEEKEGALRLNFPAVPDAAVRTLTGGPAEWRDQAGRSWRRVAPGEGAEGWTPFAITVTDQDGKLFEGLAFDYEITSREGRWQPPDVRHLAASGGVCAVTAPADCLITIMPAHPDLNRGFGNAVEVRRKGGEAATSLQLTRGLTVSGRVVDAATGRPVVGAVLKPLDFTSPGWTPDDGHQIASAEDGSFVLRGLSVLGFQVEHPDFVLSPMTCVDESKDTIDIVVPMEHGRTAMGRVADAAGKPLAGVEVSSGGMSMLTDGDGSFLARSGFGAGEGWDLKLDKPGYAELNFKGRDFPVGGFILAPLPELRGRVTGPDGAPVGEYRIVGEPEKDPRSWESGEAEVRDAGGRFTVQPRDASRDGWYWIGVQAAGFAPWQGTVEAAALLSGELRIVLQPGHTVRADLVRPAAATGDLTVELRREVAAGLSERLDVHRLVLPPGEQLEIPQVAEGYYLLSIRGTGISPTVKRVSLADGSDRDLGEIRLAGTGSISGRAAPGQGKDDPSGAGDWVFAKGALHPADYERVWGERRRDTREFHTDGEGRFHLDGVPLGRSWIEFTLHRGCFVERKIGVVDVEEGRDAEVKFGEPVANSSQLRSSAAGDGSPSLLPPPPLPDGQ